MAYEDFKAGWNANSAYHDHEWGPAPPSTSEAAWRRYKGIPEPPPTFDCPTCGTKPMVKRLNRQENTHFLGCPKFPQCRGTRDAEGRNPRTGQRIVRDEDDWDWIGEYGEPPY